MRRQIFTSAFIGAIGLTLMAGTLETLSTGAPLGSSGAPGDHTCATTGCHTGQEENSGPGELSLLLDGQNTLTEYIPGKTYTITVKMAQPGIKRFGFQLLALADADNKTTGTLTVLDEARTQILEGSGRYAGRNYMTYTAEGTNPAADGLGEWKFSWTAPPKEAGPLSLYLASVAANNDGTDKGDLVYTSITRLKAGGTTGFAEETGTGMAFNFYPNPVQDIIHIRFTRQQQGKVAIRLSTIQGRQMYNLWEGNISQGQQLLELQRPDGLSAGAYLLHIQTAEGISTQRMILQ